MTAALAEHPAIPRSFANIVSDEQRALFQDEGYMILPGVIPDDMLAMLREECAYFIGYFDAEFDLGDKKEGALSVKGKRYFINNRFEHSQRLWRFLFSELMAEVCRNTIGDEAVLFNEQWVVKGAEQGMTFSWHQDSGYVKAVDPATDHPPYVTCWCAVDDIDETNGAVYLLPHSIAGTKGRIITHDRDPDTNDLIGYTGDERGVATIVPAGSIVCFSSFNLHSSGANTADRMRRVYLPQYAAGPIRNSQTGEQIGSAIPFLRDSRIVYDRATA